MKKINKFKSQNGVAIIGTILSLGAISLGMTYQTINHQKTNQELQKVLSKNMSSQIKVWEAAEIIKLYLEDDNNKEEVNKLTIGDLTITGIEGVSAYVSKITCTINGVDCKDGEIGVKRLYVLLKSKTVDEASSNIEMVYQLENVDSSVTGSPVINLTSQVMIKNGLNMSGGAVIKGLNTFITVEGNFYTNSTSDQTNVNNICATGNLTATSWNVDYVCANGNIDIRFSNIKEVRAKGNVTTSNGNNLLINNIYADGDVSTTSGSVIGEINNGGNVYLDSNGFSSVVRTMGNVRTRGGFHTKTDIKANGNVDFYSGSFYWNPTSGSNITALGDITVRDWTGVNDAISNKTVTSINSVIANKFINAKTLPLSIPKVNLFTTPKASIDTRVLQSSANYYWYVDADNKIKIDIKNVNNVDDGTYFLGRTFFNWWFQQNFACKNLGTINLWGWIYDNMCVNSSGNIVLSGTQFAPIGSPAGAYKPMATYSNSNGWVISNDSLPPGVHFFEGSVELQNFGGFAKGHVILSTKDIVLNVADVEAPNFSGFNAVCKHSYYYGTYQNYPKQFCDMNENKLKADSIGNLSIMAGSFAGDNFIGGDITSQARASVSGIMAAGNSIQSTGAFYTKGAIVAAGQGVVRESNLANIEIDLISLPSTYNSSELICTKNCSVSVASPKVKLWARYK